MRKALIFMLVFLLAATAGAIICLCAGQLVPGGANGSPTPAAGVGKKKNTSPKLPRYGSIRMLSWSPDGSKIAFVYDIGGNAEVFTVNADGTKPKNVSKKTGEDINPVWSPDGKTLLFSSFRKGEFDICKTGPEGGKVDCFDSKGDDLWPAWSPDGQTIAFCNYGKGYPLVYFIGSDGKDRKLYYSKQACYPAFSADGKKLAVVSDSDIYVITLKNGKEKNITKPLVSGDMVEDSFPVWAPKGDRLAFIGHYEAFSSEVYTISGSGKKIRRLTDNLAEDFLPCWEPKGKGILYAGYVPGRKPEIFLSAPETPIGKKRLTNNWVLEMNPRFSPDGKKILYVSRRRSEDEIYIMNADGSDPKPFLKDKLPPIEAYRKARQNAVGQ